DKLDAVFESFSQADASTTREYGGTGLGLTICRRLTEMMGGSMSVASVEGEGSTFTFDIETHVAERSGRPDLEDRQPALRGKRVLVLDARQVTQDGLVGMARQWGMETVAAGTVLEASLALDGRPPDAVLVDEAVLVREGRTALRRLPGATLESRDAETSAPAVILISTVASDPDERRALSSDVADTLLKPVKSASLHAALTAALCDDSGATDVSLGPFVARPAQDREAFDRVRVLIADDNLVNQKVAARLLDRLGCDHETVVNGAEAVEAVQNSAYDVVLMDVQMPVMDGLEATRRIREWDGPQPHVIALTANAMDGDREACLEAGADDYLSKPVRLDQLEAALERKGVEVVGS
ncbi:response regulator, partial [Rubrivirga sp.]|uniref:response regulator n=1 Tax=Rubrivirga sp. TaxID=1885344 RepID=UPI003C78B8C1